MGLLMDRIRPGGANERARVIVMAAEAGMDDDDGKVFADTFKTVEEAKAELDRRAAEAKAKDKPASARAVLQAVAAASLPASFAEGLIAEGVTLEVARERIVNKWADQGDQHEYRPTATVGRSWDHGEGLRAKLTDGLTARLDPAHTPTMGREFASATIPQMAMTVCQAAGLRPLNEAEAVRMAAHSTSDFPLLIENSLTNAGARQMAQQPPATARLSREVRRLDYHSGKSLTLSASGMPQEIGEGGEIKFVTMDTKGEWLPTPRDFAAGFNATNTLLVNDRTDMLMDGGARMFRGAVERFRAVLLEPILANSGAGQTMADGSPMFHADHGNLAGSAAPISLTTLTAARTAMRRQKGLKGELYSIEPFALLVPPEQETAAQQIVADIQAAKFADANPFASGLEVIVEAGLTNVNAWYLVGDPARFDGLAHCFLDGQSTPRVESRAAWTTLGLELRLVWALDAKFIETASWFRNPGV